MQIVSNGDNLHEMSNPVLWEKRRQYAWNVKFCFLWKTRKNISKCCLLKFLPKMLCYSINTSWQYDLRELDTLGRLSTIFTWDTTVVTSFCSPEHPIPFKKKGAYNKKKYFVPKFHAVVAYFRPHNSMSQLLITDPKFCVAVAYFRPPSSMMLLLISDTQVTCSSAVYLRSPSSM